MSRTRIVGGNITKITGGKYKIFAKDNIEFHSNKQVMQNAKDGIFVESLRNLQKGKRIIL